MNIIFIIKYIINNNNNYYYKSTYIRYILYAKWFFVRTTTYCLFKIILCTKNKNRHNCMNKNSNLSNLIHVRNSIGSLCTETSFENVYSE